jgi:hypothetical protein
MGLTLRSARVATGLHATWQSIAWLGAAAGIFEKRGVAMTFPAHAVGGPEAAEGLARGDWEFAHTGALPVAEQVLKGRDVVIIATPTCQFASTFVMTRAEIDDLAKLDGKKVGVVTQTGQTSVAARLEIEKAGANAAYVALHGFDRVFAALATGEIEAGALPMDVRRKGEREFGWNAFPLNEFGTPSVFATTRRLLATDRELALSVMQGFVETIHAFKTRPDVVVPLLRHHLAIEDEEAAELQASYVPLLQRVPRPSLPGFPELGEYLRTTFPNAKLRAADVSDASLVDELNRSGFIDGLYADTSDRKSNQES